MTHRAVASVPSQAHPMSSRLRDFRPDVEGLRFPLILMVVLHHIGVPIFGGVDGSIALSGFLGVTIILREINRSGGFRFGRFYARRARRLLPLATLVIVTTLGAAALWLPAFKLKSLVFDALAAAGFGINFRLAAGSTDYFTEGSETSALQHYWSLAVEEQFWLLLPVFVLGMVWLMRKFKIGVWLLAVALVLVSAVSLYLSVRLTQSAQPWAYFGTHTRIWEFGLGALTAVGAPFFSRMWQSLAAAVSWVGFAVLFGGSVVIAQTSAIPGWVMIFPVLGTCLVIVGGCAAPKFGVELLLGRGPVRFIGRLSYGWYLWHWPALLIMPYALGYNRGNVVYEVLVAAGTLVLAAGTYYAVERPVKSWRILTEKPRVGLAWGARFTGVSVAAALLLLTNVTVQGSAAPKATNAIAPDKIEQLVAQAAMQNDLTAVAEAKMTTVKRQMFGRCLNDIKTTTAQPCFLGDTGSNKRLVLLGSSLAWQWVPVFDRIAQDERMQLVVFAKGSCPAQPYSVDTEAYMVEKGMRSGVYEECNTWRKDAYQQIAALKPTVVVLSSRMETESTPGAIRSGVQYFKERGAKVVLLGETPGFDSDIAECVSNHIRELQQCTKPLGELVDLTKAEAGATTARATGAVVVDPLPWLCTTVCPPVINDEPVYQDSRHLSVSFVMSLIELLRSQLPLA